MNPMHDTLRPVTLLPSKPKVEIGKRFTGKREVHYDTRTGEYCESMPVMDWDSWLIQRAICPQLLVKARRPKEIRQTT
jgi:hypothetical protein